MRFDQWPISGHSSGRYVPIGRDWSLWCFGCVFAILVRHNALWFRWKRRPPRLLVLWEKQNNSQCEKVSVEASNHWPGHHPRLQNLAEDRNHLGVQHSAAEDHSNSAVRQCKSWSRNSVEIQHKHRCCLAELENLLFETVKLSVILPDAVEIGQTTRDGEAWKKCKIFQQTFATKLCFGNDFSVRVIDIFDQILIVLPRFDQRTIEIIFISSNTRWSHVYIFDPKFVRRWIRIVLTEREILLTIVIWISTTNLRSFANSSVMIYQW